MRGVRRGVTLSVFCAFLFVYSENYFYKASSAEFKHSLRDFNLLLPPPITLTSPFDGPTRKTRPLAWAARSNVYILRIQFTFVGRCELFVRGKHGRTKNRKIRIAFVSALLPPSEARCALFSVYLYDDEKLHERPSVHFWR